MIVDPVPIEHRDRAKRFVELLTSHQRDLYAYINTLLVGDIATPDVLQDTNVDLWARLDEFDFDRAFLPWAFSFAYHRVLAYRKSKCRSRLVISDQVVKFISDEYVSDSVDADTRLGALQTCLDKLDARQSQLIRERYMGRKSVKALAARLGCSANQVSARLYRIRKALAQCIEATLASEARQ